MPKAGARMPTTRRELSAVEVKGGGEVLRMAEGIRESRFLWIFLIFPPRLQVGFVTTLE